MIAYTASQLIAMSQKQLDDLFSSSPAGDIPNGEANGTAIIAPDTAFSPEIAELISIFGWKGKTFDAAHGTLTNRILAFGLNAIVGKSIRRRAGSTARNVSYWTTRRRRSWPTSTRRNPADRPGNVLRHRVLGQDAHN